MSNNKISTAEELLENYRFEAGLHIGNRDYDLMCKFATEFAKLHVQAALEIASKKAKCCDDAIIDLGHTIVEAYVEENSILMAYPLENIK